MITTGRPVSRSVVPCVPPDPSYSSTWSRTQARVLGSYSPSTGMPPVNTPGEAARHVAHDPAVVGTGASRNAGAGPRGRRFVPAPAAWNDRHTIAGRPAGHGRLTGRPAGGPAQPGGRVPISDEKIGDFLDRLAARVPAPGGGAAAALHAAQGAALLGMVARYTTGRQYAQHEAAIGRIIAEVDELRVLALRLADADADAFTAVSTAYQLP